MGEITTWTYELASSQCDPACCDADTLSIPLSYIANTDGTYTIICDAGFNCASGEPYTLVSRTCIGSGITATPTTYVGRGNLGMAWVIGPLSHETTVTVAINLSHFGTKSASNTIVVPASGTTQTYTTYYRSTITHSLTATATAKLTSTFQWQESSDGLTWSDVNGATAITLTIGTWIGDEATSTDAADTSAYSAVPAYDRYYRCIAANLAGSTVSNVLHVTHAGGAGDPIVSTGS